MRQLLAILITGLPGAAIGAAVGATSPKGYLFVFGGLALLFAILFKFKRDTDNAYLASLEETPHLATLRSAKEAGPVVNDVPTLQLTLSVPGPNGEVELTTRDRPPNFHLTTPHLVPGATLPVYANHGKGKVRVAWEHWNSVRERLEPEMTAPVGVDPPLPEPGADEDGRRRHPIVGRLVVSSALIVIFYLLAAAGAAHALGFRVEGVEVPPLDEAALGALVLYAFTGATVALMQIVSAVLNLSSPLIAEAGVIKSLPVEIEVTVLASARRGWYLNNPCVEARLAFSPNNRHREAQVLLSVPEAWADVDLTGLTLPGRYDPAEPRRVAVEWPEAPPPS